MRRPTDDQLDALCGEAEAIVRRLRIDGPGALQRSKTGVRDGYPTSSGGGVGGGGGDYADPVGELATSDPMADPVRGAAIRMVAGLVGAVRLLRSADRARGDIVDDRGPRHEPPAGSGECEACRRYCPGGPDRIRSGLDDACYRAWLRTDTGAGRMERVDFVRLRRIEAEDRETDGGRLPAGVTLLASQRRRKAERDEGAKGLARSA